MNDKIWLEKVSVAYAEYSRQVGPKLDIENFIAWLYRQYGIAQNNKKTFIQVGAGAGDLDPRSEYRDGFTERVKSQDPNTVGRIILVEPNPTNIPLLKECWKNYPQAEIYEVGICLETTAEKFITFYYAEEDAPHFHVFSMREEHVRKHYHHAEIKSKIIECITFKELLLRTGVVGTTVDLIGLDIEGIDAEVILETDWNSINCKYLSVEHLHLGDKAQLIHNTLAAAGYQFNGNGIDHHGYDWSFIK